MPKAKYLGNYEDKKPEGFGVLIRGDVVDIGNFLKGELRGDITRFKGDHLLYRGGTKMDFIMDLVYCIRKER